MILPPQSLFRNLTTCTKGNLSSECMTLYAVRNTLFLLLLPSIPVSMEHGIEMEGLASRRQSECRDTLTPEPQDVPPQKKKKKKKAHTPGMMPSCVSLDGNLKLSHTVIQQIHHLVWMF